MFCGFEYAISMILLYISLQYVCICIYVYMYICIYVSMYLCIYVYMYICIYVYVNIYQGFSLLVVPKNLTYWNWNPKLALLIHRFTPTM